MTALLSIARSKGPSTPSSSSKAMREDAAAARERSMRAHAAEAQRLRAAIVEQGR